MEVNKKYIQTELIKGYKGFNYIGQVFEVVAMDDGIIILKNYESGVGCGVSEEELSNYFKEYICKAEQQAKEENAKVIFSNNITIVILEDGTKGIAKCLDCDTYNENKGVEIALTKAKIKSLNKKLKQLVK